MDITDSTIQYGLRHSSAEFEVIEECERARIMVQQTVVMLLKLKYIRLDCSATYIYAVQTLLIPSVSPTSFVSNSYNPTPTTTVASFNPQSNSFLVFGSRLVGM